MIIDRNGIQANSCGNCHNKTTAYQERLFFLFDTMCGHSALRCRFDGEQTPMQRMVSEGGETEMDVIPFLFEFAAYQYQKVTDPAYFQQAIVDLIDAAKPIIALAKEGDNPFRVIRLSRG